jgi:hypothetical protein
MTHDGAVNRETSLTPKRKHWAIYTLWKKDKMKDQIKVGSKVKVTNNPTLEGNIYKVIEVFSNAIGGKSAYRAKLELLKYEEADKGEMHKRDEKLTNLELVDEVKEESKPTCFHCLHQNFCGAHRAQIKLFNDYIIFKQDGASNMVQALAENCKRFKRIKEDEK